MIKKCFNEESPEYVRISFAAAITLRFMPGKFFRDAKLYCLNLLLAYNCLLYTSDAADE